MATVTFSAPLTTGGVPLRSYQYSITGGRTWRSMSTHVVGGKIAATIKGLAVHHGYLSIVRATSSVGAGPRSRVASFTTTAPGQGRNGGMKFSTS